MNLVLGHSSFLLSPSVLGGLGAGAGAGAHARETLQLNGVTDSGMDGMGW